MSEEARSLVSRALDRDWHGPPFDPIELAGVLGFELRALADVADARTVPVGRDAFRIEFNPNRPAGRIRYSVAHEIAHTLFPDCGDQVRNRVMHASASPDEWQLEALCNIAAAEILMPFGSFPTADADLINIDRVLSLQRQFKVSTEALLLRIVQLTTVPCAMFSASRLATGSAAGRWRIDYTVASPEWRSGNLRGLLLPEATSLAACGNVGFTARSHEHWHDLDVDVQAVGLPPYPGGVAPRAAGFIAASDAREARSQPLLTEVVGDALALRDERPSILAHIVNDKAQTWGGGGFAAAVRRTWPAVHDDFTSWADSFGANLRLGEVRYSDASPVLRVASMVAQHGYGPSRGARIRYEALQRCLDHVYRTAAATGSSVQMPRIGTGQAGGSWGLVRGMVEATAARWRVPTTVYRTRDAVIAPEQDSLFTGTSGRSDEAM